MVLRFGTGISMGLPFLGWVFCFFSVIRKPRSLR